jgi:hypothetical protein
MCISLNTARNSAAPTHSQTMMNAWYHVQARQRRNRQGYQSDRYSDSDSAYHYTINNAMETYSGSVPAPIDPNVTSWEAM